MTKISVPKSIASAMEKAPCSEKYLLRLYVSGVTELSRRSIMNITAICKENLQGKYDLEVVDIHQKPSLARDEQIIATPTLVKLLPLPLKRIVGDLSDWESVLFALDIKKMPTDRTSWAPQDQSRR
jgi:circadian clock protein KaiB